MGLTPEPDSEPTEKKINEALEAMGFRIDETIGNLPIHRIPRTDNFHQGTSGVVKAIETNGAAAYVVCDDCHDTLRVEL